jgi:hypothetical protein
MTSTPTPAPAPAPEARRGRSLGLRFAVAFLLGPMLVAVLGVGVLYAYGQRYSGRILPGVHIGAVDLSGMDATAARRSLADAYRSLDAGRVVISGPGGKVTASYQQLVRGPDLDAMVAEALAAGRLGQPVADLIGAPQAALRGVVLAPRITYDESRLAAAAAVAAVAAKSVDRAPVNATLTTTPDGEIEVTDSVDGRTVDQAALAASIEDRIRELDAPSEVTVDMAVTSQPPAIDTASALETQATAERMTSDLVLTLDNKHWKIVKEKGKVIRTTTYYSHYSTITGVVQVDTGGSTGTTATSKP